MLNRIRLRTQLPLAWPDLSRVRSLDRIVPHKRCGTQFVKGRLLRQNVKKHYNQFTSDYAHILQVTLMLENRRYEYDVRRLIYAAFINPNVLHDDKRIVISADNDGMNCCLTNLRLVTNSEKQKLVCQRHRSISCLAYAGHSKFKPAFKRWTPVHRCDLNGRILETYPCVAHAAEKKVIIKGKY